MYQLSAPSYCTQSLVFPIQSPLYRNEESSIATVVACCPLVRQYFVLGMARHMAEPDIRDRRLYRAKYDHHTSWHYHPRISLSYTRRQRYRFTGADHHLGLE